MVISPGPRRNDDDDRNVTFNREDKRGERKNETEKSGPKSGRFIPGQGKEGKKLIYDGGNNLKNNGKCKKRYMTITVQRDNTTGRLLQSTSGSV